MHQTVRQLAANFVAQGGGQLALASPDGGAEEEEDLDALLAEIEGLSDEEVQERLEDCNAASNSIADLLALFIFWS